MKVPVLNVSFSGAEPAMRTVQLRTASLRPGVLCDVWANERMHLCLVERINDDGTIIVRPLPSDRSETQTA